MISNILRQRKIWGDQGGTHWRRFYKGEIRPGRNSPIGNFADTFFFIELFIDFINNMLRSSS